MECLAILKGLKVTASLGFSGFDVESDALSVVKALTLDWLDRSPVQHLVEDIKRVARWLHFNCCFLHTCRRCCECNKVARLLTRGPESFRQAMIWVASFSTSEPPFHFLKSMGYLVARFLIYLVKIN